jgi:DNA-binding IclR family transcriptional regulator/nitroimidazol reductase NimA-like FMN-containing flavoprotein (pyridoxamine 5'-phosphate oxidase superfamily)
MTDEPIAPTSERTLRLIELLFAQPDGMTAQELLDQLEISRSSLFLLLRALKNLAYIEQAEKRGRYRPGPKLQAWQSAPSPASQDLLTAFYQETGSKRWQETLALALLTSEGPYILAQVEGSLQVRSVFKAGQVNTDLTGVAQVLSSMPPVSVQEEGYSLVPKGDSLDLVLPICRDGLKPDAGLILSSPAYRWRVQDFQDSYLAEMKTMAARISHRLGAAFYTPYRSETEDKLWPETSLEKVDLDAFLQGPCTARLACVRPDGSPHVVPVWQEWNGKCFYILAWQGSQWAEYLLQNQRVSLTVDEPWPPLRRIAVDGLAEPLQAEDTKINLDALLTRMANRYLGGAASGLSSQVQLAFRITPERIRGWQGLPGPMIV